MQGIRERGKGGKRAAVLFAKEKASFLAVLGERKKKTTQRRGEKRYERTRR